VRALVSSPITGADGNVEYLAWARRGQRQLDDDALATIVRSAA
jgi:hypothetical protein